MKQGFVKMENFDMIFFFNKESKNSVELSENFQN